MIDQGTNFFKALDENYNDYLHCVGHVIHGIFDKIRKYKKYK